MNTGLLGFEKTEEIREYLKNLNNSYEVSIAETSGTPYPVNSKSKFYKLPKDILFITYEGVLLEGGESLIEVKPIQ